MPLALPVSCLLPASCFLPHTSCLRHTFYLTPPLRVLACHLRGWLMLIRNVWEMQYLTSDVQLSSGFMSLASSGTYPVHTRITLSHTSLSHITLSLGRTRALTLILTISVSHTQHTFTHTPFHTFISILYQDAEAGWLYLDQDLLCVRPRSWAWRHATSPADPDSLYIPLQPSSPFRFLANSSVSSVCSVSACTVNTKAWPLYTACGRHACACAACAWACVDLALHPH